MEALFLALSVLIGLCQVVQVGLPIASLLNNAVGVSCVVAIFVVEESQHDALQDAWANRGGAADMRSRK